jgi:hypothetical protein
MRNSCTPLLEPPDDEKGLPKHMQGCPIHVVYVFTICICWCSSVTNDTLFATFSNRKANLTNCVRSEVPVVVTVM